jgi:hypothetical protein
MINKYGWKNYVYYEEEVSQESACATTEVSFKLYSLSKTGTYLMP